MFRVISEAFLKLTMYVQSVSPDVVAIRRYFSKDSSNQCASIVRFTSSVRHYIIL